MIQSTDHCATTAHPNLPASPAELERRLKTATFDIMTTAGAGGGVMGAKKLAIVFRDDHVALDVKWKEAPSGGDGWNNSPRREIGVYEVQKLFLDPVDYVIPPVAVRCFDLEAYGAVKVDPAPNLVGTRCVYGALAVWLKDCTEPKRAFDPELFASNSRYAYHFANLNLLHYLTKHRDARANNFLMSDDPRNPQVFSIDNGIAFGKTLFNFFSRHFDKLRVDRLPQKSIDRLRRVSRAELDRLGVLAELHADAAGILRDAATGPNRDRQEGNRLAPGLLQIGLTGSEIDAIELRLKQLLKRIDRGKLGTF